MVAWYKIIISRLVMLQLGTMMGETAACLQPCEAL